MDMLLLDRIKASMKRTKAVFGMLTISLALVAQVQAQSFLTNGLVAYYPFNGNANDASGNGINGTVEGATLTTNRLGSSNSAYLFDGVSAFIDYSNPPALEFRRALTLTAWIDPQAGGGFTQVIADKEYEYQIALRGGSLACGLSCGGIPETWSETTVGLPKGVWTQVALVYDGTNAILFTNAVSVATFVLGGPITNSSPGDSMADFTIGSSQLADPSHNCFSGAIDDVRLYNRALSDAEVQQLQAYESAPPCIPHSATATATLVNGFAVGATITDGGCGYTNTPAVFISGGGGTGASATAVVSNGVVVNLIFTEAGTGYTSPPSIYIYSPLGLQISIVKAVKPAFSGLLIDGTNYYQLQVSSDLKTWTNSGAPFKATKPSLVYPQDFDVEDWSQLFFRLVP
jgi:hypothetical protein